MRTMIARRFVSQRQLRLAPKLALAALAALASIIACSSDGSSPSPEQGGSAGAGTGSGAMFGTGGVVGGTSGGGAAPTGSGGIVGGTGGATIDASRGGGPASGGAPGSGGAMIGDGAAADAGPLDGLNVDGKCFPLCASAITDPDGDGYGFENQTSCVVAGSAPTRGRTPCATGIVSSPVGQIDGVQTGGVCYPLCANASADPDGDGYGYDSLLQLACIVSGTAAAAMGSPCHTGIVRPQPPTPGDGFFIGGVCYPHCINPASDPDGDGWGFEDGVCVVTGSTTATMALTCAPAQVPKPPPPPGTGWISDYTATMFGQVDCAPLGFTDSTDINRSACVSRNAVTLNSSNETYFGAPGDLSTLWTGAACTCPAGQTTCVPACNGQQDCAMCVEIACNAGGVHSFMNNGDTHDRYCRPGQSVVVQIIDACPHNHVNNTYWCTSARPNHIDLSCSAFQQITQGATVGTIGFVNTYVRPVDCSAGLGPKTL